MSTKEEALDVIVRLNASAVKNGLPMFSPHETMQQWAERFLRDYRHVYERMKAGK